MDNEPHSPPSLPLPLRCVLVVDDNVDTAVTLEMLLKMSGDDVQVWHDGGQALMLAESFRPEFTLLDIGLPLLNGLRSPERFGLSRGARQ